MHLPPKQDDVGSNPTRIAEDFDINERIFVKTEFYMNMVQMATTFGIIGYAVGKTLYDKIR